jgi:archaellum component FlaC
MPPNEQGRRELFLALEDALGTEPARTLMEQLPPRRWDDLATHDDLARFDERFVRIDEQFVRIDERFVRIDERFERIDERFTVVDQRFDRIERRLDGHDARFTGIEHTLARIEAKFDEKFRGLDDRFEASENRVIAEFRGELIAHSRLMFFSMVGAIFTAASLAFAAVRF